MVIYSRYALKVLVWMISILSCSLTAQVTPIQYSIFPRPSSIYGSSENGNCSTVPIHNNGELCSTPKTSYLFDGIIPFYNRTNKNKCWASQLLALHSSSIISLVFLNTSGATSNIEGLEIVMFNCIEEGGGINKIIFQPVNGKSIFIPITERSCDHLIRVCASFNATMIHTISLSFGTNNYDAFVYLAEITFHSTRTDCTTGIIETPETHTTTMNQISIVNEDTTVTKETDRVNHSSLALRNSTITTSLQDDNFNSSINIISTKDFNSNVVTIAVVVTIIFIIIISLTVTVTALVVNKKIREKITLKISKNVSKTCNNHEESVMYFPDTVVDDKFEVDTYATLNNQDEENSSNTRHVDVKKSLTKNNGSTSDSEKDQDNISTMYAVVNKCSQKNKTTRNLTSDSHNISEMYAIVDKSAKKKAATVKSSNPDVSEMYAVVDKSSKKRAKEGLSSGSSPGTSELYAIVNKKGKKKEEKNKSSSGISDVYAVVDKSKIQQKASKGQ